MNATTWHIVGAGAMGTLLHHRLQERGIDSVLLQRRREPEQRCLREDGIDFEYTAQPLAAISGGQLSAVVLATKAGQLARALAGIRDHLHPRATIIVLANGLGFEQALIDLCPTARFYRAVSTAGAYRDACGHVIVAARGKTSVGRLQPEADQLAEVPAAVFSDSLGQLEGWQWDPDITTAAGRKFAINCVINVLTVQQRCRNGELLAETGLGGGVESGAGASADAGADASAEKAANERLESATEAVAGPALHSLCEEAEPVLVSLGLWPEGRSLEAAAVAVCRQTAGNRSSMLQDVLAGRSTELAYLNLEFLRRARAAGLRIPLQEQLAKDVAALSSPPASTDPAP